VDLVDSVIAPVVRRIGTAVGGFLGGIGIATHDANAAGAAVVVLLGVGADILVMAVRKRWFK